jgi:hypothetical protein
MDLFIIKLILSFFIGAIWITSVTVISEKFGTKLGGVLGGLPSTCLIALFFIGWTQSPSIASQATSIMPFVNGVDAMFIVVFVFLGGFNFYLGLFGCLLFWLVSSFSMIYLGFDNFGIGVITCIILTIIAYYLVEKKLNVKSIDKKEMHYTIGQILFRALLSGSVIALAVFLAKVGGPLMGGAFSQFPALYSATIIITYLAHGKEFSFAMMKALLVSASVNVLVFTIAVRYLYLYVGLVYGTILAFLISLVSCYLVYLFVNKRME